VRELEKVIPKLATPGSRHIFAEDVLGQLPLAQQRQSATFDLFILRLLHGTPRTQ
jgi:hypothetical protein